MLYRKAPLAPSRMLLRVAAVAATGALVGACSSTSRISGFAPDPDAQGDDATDCSSPGSYGTPGCPSSSVYYPPDASPDADAALACGTGICGSIAVPTDAGVDAEAGPDADAALACGTGVCGSIVMPNDAAADGTPDQ